MSQLIKFLRNLFKLLNQLVISFNNISRTIIDQFLHKSIIDIQIINHSNILNALNTRKLLVTINTQLEKLQQLVPQLAQQHVQQLQLLYPEPIDHKRVSFVEKGMEARYRL